MQKKLFRQLPTVASIVVLLIIWQILAGTKTANTAILPTPTELAGTMRVMVRDGELWIHIVASIKRVLIGFFIASICGVVLGIASGTSPRIGDYFSPLIEFVRPIPPIAWIPIAILWFGIGDRPSYFIVAIGAFFPIFLNSLKGVRFVDPSYIQVAKNLGANRILLLTDVFIPAALPYILTGLRVGMGIAWTSVIAAELVGAQSGLGYMIQLNRILLSTGKVISGMIMIGLVGFLLNGVLAVLEKRWLYWMQDPS